MVYQVLILQNLLFSLGTLVGYDYLLVLFLSSVQFPKMENVISQLLYVILFKMSLIMIG